MISKKKSEASAGLGTLIQGQLKSLLKLRTFEQQHTFWLDTGSPSLNGSLGSSSKGIPYGKLLELRGLNHGGKTTMGLVLAAMAQADGAAVGYIDIESSSDQPYAEKFGLAWKDIILIQPKLLKRKDKLPILQSAESMCEEAETAMALAARTYDKQFWLLDSIAMLRTGLAIAAGRTGQNMRTNADRAMFLSSMLPEWVGLAANYNATIVLINQMRKKQGMVFGSPDYSPGGAAMEHACAVRADVRRVGNGIVRRKSRIVGICGKIVNFKNKAGGGSLQGEDVAFHIRSSGVERAVVKFMSVEEAKELIGVK